MTQKEFEERTQCAVNAETFAIINRLYMATDMYKDDFCKELEAVRLAGEVEVVKRTIELGLPLWDEDRKVVLSMIEEQGK